MALPLIPPNQKMLSQIHDDLCINEDRHKRLVEVFQDWISNESYLPSDIDYLYLSNFLIMCKDDLAKAKRKFEENIIRRKKHCFLDHEHLIPVSIFVENEIARQMVPLPRLTSAGYRIICISLPKILHKFDLKILIQYAVILIDIALFEDHLAGAIFIADYHNCSVQMAAKIDLLLMFQFITFVLHALPPRLICFHIINAPPAITKLIPVIKTTLPEKIKKRVIVHGEAKSLNDYFPKELLPVDYEGTLPSLDNLSKDWERYYIENEEWKSKLKKLRLVNEIPTDTVNLDSDCDFGIDGSFRNLQFF